MYRLLIDDEHRSYRQAITSVANVAFLTRSDIFVHYQLEASACMGLVRLYCCLCRGEP